MDFNIYLLFFFSALGVLNGLILAGYFLFFAKPKHISNTFLGLLFLILSIRIGKSVFFYFMVDLSGVFIQIGITACFFIGPFLYFYIKSVMRPINNINRSWIYHIAFLLPLILIVGIRYPYFDHLHLWQDYFMNLVYLEWFLYLIFSGVLLVPAFQKLFDKSLRMKAIDIWVINVFVGTALIWIAYFSSYYTSYMTGAITFSLLTYLLILLLVFSRKKQSVLFKNAFSYVDKKIEETRATELLESLDELMRTKKLYKNADLKLAEVAKQIALSTHQMSQLLNDNLGKSFPNWLNEYRIHEAKELIRSHDKYSIESIGYECGFNSKSTFYTAFKRITQTTPSQFKEGL
ncbi:helix-turn-helix domain-containing protein [Croceitalea sp. MTPC9]|uniref:helix-turn-helix domain-containing protein n=1 Tax=unclassified Croceitalea TaxID=2632280 RepID=UPI002B39411D|nr:helix-turn-helix domain-containing protein [Croceitalea sp. MTPC6]GMN15707.1 helix-turn-helix domain-containing protein [Croceitalea sp. MTPC9]